MATRELKVNIVGNSRDLERALGRASSASSGFGRSLKTLGKVAAIGVGAAFAGLAATLKVGFDELSEGQKVAAQTNAVLKSTGGVANVTAKEVAKLAEEQSKLTGIDDELIQTSENLLLTFKNVRNEVGQGSDVFNRATKAALDLSTAGFGSVESASKMMGKALNDPIKGMTALGRAGVTFSDDQKKAIKALVETGDVLGAQKLILKEVESQVGGSAKAYGETLPGQLSKLRNNLEETAGSLAEKFLPAALAVTGGVNDFITRLGEAEGAGAKFGVVMDTLKGIASQAWDALKAAFNAINWGEVWNVISTKISDGAAAAWSAIKSTFNAINWGEVGRVVGQAVRTGMDKLSTFIESVNWGAVGQAAVRGFTLMIKAVATFLANVDWPSLLGKMIRLAAAILRGLASLLLAAALELGKAIVQGLIDGAQNLWGRFVAWVQTIPGKVKGLFANAGQWLYDAGLAILQGLWDGLKAKWDAVAEWVGGLGGKIASLKGPPSKDATLLTKNGELIMQSLQNGMGSGWGPIETWLGTLGDKMATKVGDAIDKAAQAVSARQGVFASAFDSLTSNALAAFDKLTSEFETKTEKLMRRQDESRAKAERQQALTEAKTAKKAAQDAFSALVQEEGESVEAFAARQAAALQAIADAEKQRQEALFQINRAANEKKAAQERKEYEDKRERQRVSLEKQLAKLQQNYLDQELTTQQFHKNLLGIFKKFEIPLGKSANKLGAALAQGLNDSFADVQAAARALAQEILDQFSKIRVIINVDLSVKNGKADERQHGGPVRRGRPYVVGEAGPELFVPSTSGRIIPNGGGSGGLGVAAAGTTVVVNVAGSVVTEREVGEFVYNYLLARQRRIGSLGFN